MALGLSLGGLLMLHQPIVRSVHLPKLSDDGCQGNLLSIPGYFLLFRWRLISVVIAGVGQNRMLLSNPGR